MYDKFISLTLMIFIVMGNSSTIDLSGGMLYKGLPVKITDIFFIIIILKNIKLKIKYPKLKDNLLLLWILFGIVSIFLNFYIYDYSFSEIRYGMLYPLRMIIYILAIKFIAKNLNKRFSFRKIMNKINSYYLVVCIIGIFQYVFFPNAFEFYKILKGLNIYILNPDPHYKRLFGTYLDPNFLGSILIIPIGLTLAEIFTSRYKKRKLLKILQLCFQILVVILTSSRSGILGVVAVLLIFFLLDIFNRNRKMKKLFFKLFVVGGSILSILLIFSFEKIRVFQRIVNFKTDPSAQARFSSFSTGFEQIQENFMIGVGYNMMGFYTGNSDSITGFGSNSSLIFILITTGIIGTLIFLAYIVKNININLKYRNKKNYFYINALISIILSSLVVSNFNNLLVYPLWICIYLLLNELCLKNNKKRRNKYNIYLLKNG